MPDRPNEAGAAAPSHAPMYPPRPRVSASRAARAEPAWETVTKWCLLVVAVSMTCVVGAELVRTLLTLSEAPIAIVAGRRPPAPEPPVALSKPAESRPAPSEHDSSDGDLERLLVLLERLDSSRPPTPSEAETPAEALPVERADRARLGPAQQPVRVASKHGVVRPAGPARAPRRPARVLRLVRPPRVLLIGADALVEATLENLTGEDVHRRGSLQLRVDGRVRQERRIRVHLPPRGRVHVSERFSTTLPDGTYSATLNLDSLLGAGH